MEYDSISNFIKNLNTIGDILNSRQNKIFKLIVKSYKLVTKENLALMLNVTSRTITNDLNIIRETLKEQGADIQENSNNEIELIINNEVILNKFIEKVLEKKNNIPNEPNDRVNYIIRKFLTEEKYIRIDDLIDELIVSRSTLDNDLKKVRAILKEFNLSLQPRPNYGLIINGAEINIRNAISELLFERNMKQFINLFEKEWLLERKNIILLYKILVENLKLFNIKVSDDILNNLLIHIVIIYVRFEKKMKTDSLCMEHLENEKEYSLAYNILKDIENELNITFRDCETVYLTMHLFGTNLFGEDDSKEIRENNCDISRTTKKAINEIDRVLNLSLSNDNKFFFSLMGHLKPAIYRIKNKMNIRNPLLHSIKVNYPYAFHASVIMSEIFKEELNIEFSEEEIGYIALHIGNSMERKNFSKEKIKCIVVSSADIISSNLLLHKLKEKLSDTLNIVGVVSLNRLSDVLNEEIKFIISTVVLPKNFKVPYFIVDDILGDVSFKSLRNEINQKEKAIINNYINEQLIYIEIDKKSPEEIIKFLSTELSKKINIDEKILKSILNKESIASTYFGNLVAIPYLIIPQTEDPFLTIATLKNPIDWYGKKVQLVCLINLSKKNNLPLEPLYKKLMKLISNPKLVQQIIKSKSVENIRNIFNMLN